MIFRSFPSISLFIFCLASCATAENGTTCNDPSGFCSASGNRQDVIELFKKFPDFLRIHSPNLTAKCKEAVTTYELDLADLKVNALKMFDATGKLPSGILSGNVNQYGNFDECLSVKNAQYCLAEIDVRPIWTGPFRKFENRVHSYFAFKDEFGDPKHRVPGFTSICWGFCMPSACTPGDLEESLVHNLKVRASVNPPMCQRASVATNQTFGYFFARVSFLTLGFMIATSTVCVQYSLLENNNNKLKEIIHAFAVQNNWRRLTSLKSDDSEEIRAVHGVRFMSALGLIMAHKAMALFYNPYINRTEMIEHYGLPWSVSGRTAIIYTDSFIFLSGLLSANSLFGDIFKGKGLRFKDKLITRIFRISPNVIAVILFCTYILPELGSGPMWPVVIDHHSVLCKSYMWRNIFYIHNYFGFQNMCLTHSHQVGIDMQLFLTTPLFVYLIWFNRKVGLLFLASIATLSTFLRFWVSWQNNLSCMVHFGITIQRMFDTANLSYILPTHRVTVYLMGVFTAYILRTTPKVTAFSKIQIGVLWLFALAVGFAAMLGPFHMAVKDYTYNKLDGAVYCAVSPIFWGIGVGWTIYAANRGCGGWFGDFLSWRGFQFFTKISYAVYLVQFPVFFYNVGITRHVGEFKPRMIMELPETLVIVVISVLLTLCIEMPFQHIKKIIFDDGSKLSQETATIRSVHKKSRKLG